MAMWSLIYWLAKGTPLSISIKLLFKFNWTFDGAFKQLFWLKIHNLFKSARCYKIQIGFQVHYRTCSHAATGPRSHATHSSQLVSVLNRKRVRSQSTWLTLRDIIIFSLSVFDNCKWSVQLKALTHPKTPRQTHFPFVIQVIPFDRAQISYHHIIFRKTLLASILNYVTWNISSITRISNWKITNHSFKNKKKELNYVHTHEVPQY